MDSDFTSILDDAYFCAFREAWEKLRSGNNVPMRSDVRLQDFARFAPDLLLYELKSPNDLRCRLMGSSVSDRVKLQSMDINWLDLVASDMRAAGENWWNSLSETPCAGIMQYSTAFIDGTNRLSRCLLLPVKHSSGSTMLLGMTKASNVYLVGEPREQIVVSADCFQGQYIDIGFGLPKGTDERLHTKLMAPEILARLLWSD